MKRIGIVIIVVILLGIAFAWVRNFSRTAAPAPIATVLYSCDAGKTINAIYYSGEPKPAAGPDMPPSPGGSVAITLSDGRAMTLPQTISASGIRYANADESFVFWSKGEGALVLESNEEKSYIGCIAVVPEPRGEGLTRIYSNSSEGFSIRLPSDYTIDESYRYPNLDPGKIISGIKFTIPELAAAGTNLGVDTYISVEEIPQTQACTANLFMVRDEAERTIPEGKTTYSFASSTGAAAGNRWDEQVYALSGTNPCVAVRYFIHYGVIENYPAGAVQEFDETSLIAEFDAIRRTLIIVQ